jgi:uncharacterized membrane protein
MKTVVKVQSVDFPGKKFHLIPIDGSDQYDSYKAPASAMLAIATFAAAITFNIILTPRDNGQAIPGLDLLAYANSLFCGSIVGCILITVAIELSNHSKDFNETRVKNRQGKKNTIFYIGRFFLQIPGLSWFITIVVGVVGVMLQVAFYLMIYATRLYLKYDNPFILGTAIYFGFGAIAIILWIGNLWGNALLAGEAAEDDEGSNHQEGASKAGEKSEEVVP